MTTPPHENLTRDEAQARAALLRDPAYQVQLDLTRGDEWFGTDTTIRFGCTTPGATTFVDCTAASVERVVLNGRELPRDAIGPTRIRLDGLAADNELRVVASMAYRHEGKGLHFFRDPADKAVYLHSQCEPFDAHLIYPCFDQPDLKGEFDFVVDAPERWVVVSNMPVVDRPAEGEPGRWTFARTPRVSTYITAVVAGEYASVHDRHGDIDLGLYVRRSLRDALDPEEIFEITRAGFDWFDEHFGIAYPFGKYDQLFVPEFSAGAMENPGCVTFSEAYVFRSKVTDAARERRAETILHEMAHMWFGDLVTMQWWDDLWLNESFATFCSVLCQSLATRFEDSWVTFLHAEKAWAKYQDQLPSTHPIAADMVDIESVHQNFDGITYAKGASVLRQLVAWVGQDAFLAGCREYFRRHQWGNAELVDFLQALEEASGRDLSGWTGPWLQTTGVNTLSARHTVADDGTFADFAIEQTADGDEPVLRPHRVAVGVYDWDGDRLVRIGREELDVAAAARTPVPALVGAPAGALVMVNDDDLTYAKVRMDPRTTEVLTKHLSSLASPLARGLAWSSAWDMARDAELSATRFVELVVNNAATEDVGVMQRLALRARLSAERFADASHRDDLLRGLADHARAELAAAVPGSDHQLAWARHWADCVVTPDQVAEVRRLLDGDLRVDGLAVDADLRWHLVVAIARNDADAEPLIARELDRDATDLGERNAARARAARPSAAAKAEAWELLTAETDLSHTMSREVWGGFVQFRQPDLVAPYVDRYFASLDDLWSQRSTEWVIEFTGGMFPHPCAGEELLAKADAALAREDLPRPVRRVLLEEHDTLRRALAAKALDARQP